MSNPEESKETFEDIKARMEAKSFEYVASEIVEAPMHSFDRDEPKHNQLPQDRQGIKERYHLSLSLGTNDEVEIELVDDPNNSRDDEAVFIFMKRVPKDAAAE